MLSWHSLQLLNLWKISCPRTGRREAREVGLGLFPVGLGTEGGKGQIFTRHKKLLCEWCTTTSRRGNVLTEPTGQTTLRGL